MKPLLLILLLFMAVVPAYAQSNDQDLSKIKEHELEQVRERIGSLKKSMDRAAKDRDKLTADLQDAELKIAASRKQLTSLEADRQASTNKKLQLDTNLEKRQAELKNELDGLALQVRSAYMSGGQQPLKLLLNQRDPATLGRVMTYYAYLSQYRADNIEHVNASIQELRSLREQAASAEAHLKELASTRFDELAELGDAQDQRQALLVKINAKLDKQGQEVNRLAAEEKDLTRLIEELTSILSDYPIRSEEPFAQYKGRLTWPVAGKLLHDFGQPRVAGQLKWNGVVLAAPRGTEVRAVYHGRVVFADWLAGMGLLVIVDHGDSYLTLYGYNETILKQTGDWVAPGDAIATVGASGGQPVAALYFEIRKGKKPIDPHQWVTRRPRS